METKLMLTTTAFQEYNPNPQKKLVTDCLLRSLCKLTGKEWGVILMDLAELSLETHDMPNGYTNFTTYLDIEPEFTQVIDHKENMKYLEFGEAVESIDKHVFTIKEFCQNNPTGKFFVHVHGHVVSIVDGYYYDTWDSGDRTVLNAWRYDRVK